MVHLGFFKAALSRGLPITSIFAKCWILRAQACMTRTERTGWSHLMAQIVTYMEGHSGFPNKYSVSQG